MNAQPLDRYHDWSGAPEDEPGMVGGSKGRRFMTNGHFMVAIGETSYTSALARGWRNVTTTDHWGAILALGSGRRAETARIPALSVVVDGGVKIGSIAIAPAYVDLLRELGADEVLVIHDHPMAFALAPSVAIISAVPIGDDVPRGTS